VMATRNGLQAACIMRDKLNEVIGIGEEYLMKAASKSEKIYIDMILDHAQKAMTMAGVLADTIEEEE